MQREEGIIMGTEKLKFEFKFFIFRRLRTISALFSGCDDIIKCHIEAKLQPKLSGTGKMFNG